MYNAFGLRGLAFPLTSRYSSCQIPLYIGLGHRGRDKPGFMPLVLYTWLATLMQNRDRWDNVMIFDRDMDLAAKVAALNDPPQPFRIRKQQWAPRRGARCRQRG